MTQQVMLLRVALYAAAQQLRGKEAEEFWTLIQEVARLEEPMRTMYDITNPQSAHGDKL